MAQSGDVTRLWENWQGEVDGAATYRALADAAKDPKLAQVYANLAKMEEDHTAFWEQKLKEAGHTVRRRRPTVRARVLMWLARRLGPDTVAPTVAAFERVDQNFYTSQPETQGTRMVAQERWHATVMQQMVKTQPQQGMEGRHRNVGGNALRAAVLGANDGLCSNLSLIMGVAGAEVNNHGILVAGFAGLLAGACSMALGEWISVTSSRELAEREIRIESSELEMDPKAEGEELRLIYESKGLSPQKAKEVADDLLSKTDVALDALVREELGIDPDDLGGSAFTAASTSFGLFTLGAIVPLLPFVFLTGMMAVITSFVVSGLALFGMGAAITLFTGRSIWFTGLRQLTLGLAAAGIVFGVGRLLGVALSG
ncbi:MAG TPA: VIT1/CCC1 transporter family protein [bacterium]